jgi:hypothetical protein
VKIAENFDRNIRSDQAGGRQFRFADKSDIKSAPLVTDPFSATGQKVETAKLDWKHFFRLEIIFGQKNLEPILRLKKKKYFRQ